MHLILELYQPFLKILLQKYNKIFKIRVKNNQKSYGNLIKNGIFTQLQLLGTQLFGVYKKTTYLCQQILDESRIRRIIKDK